MDEVRKRSAQVEAMAAHWPMIDALMGGTAAMRAAGRHFLPRFPREEDDSYADRLATATLFSAYERTVSILTGKPFSKPVTIGENVPPAIAGLLANVDREGRNLHCFAAELATHMLSHGFTGILVDCPPSSAVLQGRVPSLAEERAAGVRPYFVHIKPDQLLGFRVRSIAGQTVLTQLRLLELVEEDAGPFATKTVEQVRVLEPGAWWLYRKTKDANGHETWAVFDSGLTTLDVIPFVPLYGKRVGFMDGRPPLLELAFSNVEHWQSKSDQQTILRVARTPILFVRGLGETEIVIGANSFIRTGSETADIKFVEHSGKSIEAGRVSLLDLEDRMRQTGAELLVIKPGNATKIQVAADNEQGKCDLQRMIQGLEDGLDQALALAGRWIGETGETGHVDVFDDFGAASLEDASASMLFAMQQAGVLSHETLLAEQQRRGIISSDIDIAAEIATASAEFAARQEAVAKQEKISAG